MGLLAATRLAEPFLLWNQWLPPAFFEFCVHIVQWVGVPFAIGGMEADTIWIRSSNNLFSIGTMVLVTMLYSTTGGLRSVVNTDLVQFVIGIVASIGFAWVVVDYVRVLAGLSHRRQELAPTADGYILTADAHMAFTRW